MRYRVYSGEPGNGILRTMDPKGPQVTEHEPQPTPYPSGKLLSCEHRSSVISTLFPFFSMMITIHVESNSSSSARPIIFIQPYASFSFLSFFPFCFIFSFSFSFSFFYFHFIFILLLFLFLFFLILILIKICSPVFLSSSLLQPAPPRRPPG